MIDEARTKTIVDSAVAWALARLGSEDHTLRCLAFVEDAYERPNGIEVFGADSARESATLYRADASRGPSPKGAFVFFDCEGPIRGDVRNWGHVGLALGDGRMVHAWGTVRVDPIAEVLDLPAAPGWSMPVYLGWASPDRILEGAIERDWAV
jgi:cell wall-associated NlpC family hydrolase